MFASKLLKKITDENILFDIAKNNSNGEVRLDAIEMISNEANLIELAKNYPHPLIRKVAVRRINNDSVLIDITKNDSDNFVCMDAIANINDKFFLIDVAKNNPNYCIRKVAIRTIYGCSDIEECIEKIDDDSFLKDIGKNATGEIRIMANRKREGKSLFKCPSCNSFDVKDFKREYDDNYQYGWVCQDCGREFNTYREWKGEDYTYNI